MNFNVWCSEFIQIEGSKDIESKIEINDTTEIDDRDNIRLIPISLQLSSSSFPISISSQERQFELLRKLRNFKFDMSSWSKLGFFILIYTFVTLSCLTAFILFA